MKVSTALIIPTLNAGPFARTLIESLRSQTRQPDAFLVIDSGSNDGTVENFRAAGALVRTIPLGTFDHGITRQAGIDAFPNADIIMFLTQDAIPAGADAFERLIACFEEPGIAAAYGRQIPRVGAYAIEAHARVFNYPVESRVVELKDRETLGMKTAFLSNSFAAWRRSDLLAVGGFPSKLIMGEDTCAAAKLLLMGKKVAYCAAATVYHSHNYSLLEEFRRYFDTGVLHAQAPWLRASFGTVGGEGLRYLKSELRYLSDRDPLLIPGSLLRNLLKYLGFRLGLQEKRFPIAVKRRLSMFRAYWSHQC